MKDEMNFDDFEKFLQDEVGNQKMFPSDHVWNNIAEKIQPKKSWPALTLISSVILLSLGVATFLNYPPENILDKIHDFKTINFTSKQTTNNLNRITPKSNLVLSSIKIDRPSNTVVAAKGLSKESKLVFVARHSSILSSSTNLNANSNLAEDNIHNPVVTRTTTDENLGFAKGTIAAVNNLKDVNYPVMNKELISPENNNSRTKKQIISSKLDYEIYATPSISYRSLVEDQVITQLSTNATPVNNTVSQKAGLGSELGIGLRYMLSKELTFKTGLQFDLRQYSIDAYKSSGLAKIDVVQNNALFSIDVASKYSNNSGVAQTTLNNRLYQVSIPLGLELNAYSGKHLGVSIGASLQPTYSINKNVYILSTDYKYYANGESLFRKWNINSSINANITYKLNKTTFYLGPQVRYQHLPTYVDKYPIKEYRVDYGVRLGIIRPIK